MVAIVTLKKMIRSWLDDTDTYPDMLEAERERRAEVMDVSLLEQTKEEHMKSMFEINSVIRMSFIEMQFIKKVSFTKPVRACHSIRANSCLRLL